MNDEHDDGTDEVFEELIGEHDDNEYVMDEQEDDDMNENDEQNEQGEISVEHVEGQQDQTQQPVEPAETVVQTAPLAVKQEKHSVSEIAETILSRHNRPMKAKELYDIAVKEGMFKSKAVKAYTSFATGLNISLKRKNCKLVKAERGTFKLAN